MVRPCGFVLYCQLYATPSDWWHQMRHENETDVFCPRCGEGYSNCNRATPLYAGGGRGVSFEFPHLLCIFIPLDQPKGTDPIRSPLYSKSHVSSLPLCLFRAFRPIWHFRCLSGRPVCWGGGFLWPFTRWNQYQTICLNWTIRPPWALYPTAEIP